MKDPLKDLNITDLATMEENGDFAIVCLNKQRHSSSSSSSIEEKESNRSEKRRVKPIALDYPKKNGEILSGQYGINLLLFGIALMLGVSYHGYSIKEKHLLSFITTVMLIQLLWMLWYVVRRDRQKNSVPEKDSHAGTRWLRGGLTILALLSLIMDAFRIAVYVGYKECLSPTLGVYPVVHVLHTVSQVYFLWFHIKDVIKTCQTFERFGVIHAVFTNLLLWCNGAMSESQHFLEAHKKRLASLGFINYTGGHDEPHCECAISSCSMFSKSLYYLYPFNIEYHIFVSAMLFVMWKNIGRIIEHQHKREKDGLRVTRLVLGPILGLVALAGTITILVIYIMQVEESLETHRMAISMFYCHGIVMLACMCIAGTLGLILYRLDNRPLDASKNPSRQLDTELLCGSSVGTWLMSWCSVIAAVATHSNPRYRWTILAYSLLLVLEKYIQNLFIIESLYRQQEAVEEGEGEGEGERGGPSGIFSVSSQVPSCRGIVNQAFTNQENVYVSLNSSRLRNGNVPLCSLNQELQEPPVVPVSQDRAGKPDRRQILRNIAIFLFLCNCSLWLLPAFGCRPQYDNGLEQETFGFTIWTMVLNFAMPLNLFYRMHCVASLFEVFQHV
ncbi:proton channel OTOP1-like [Conger conger]|uniref:proton channel OTOP1-like n=1 Tax=Conger conger TaxID=82655 RepID=UPI002A5A7DA7|nr:proton channel OTOP1-like [Conger conger]